MIINHNIPALNTYRSLTINNENTSKSLAKLSSGLRINNAGDDAAGLAISEKMRSQIRGLDQASRNAYDGKSLLQTAEGALNETHSILQRMKELAVQSANSTNTQFDRTEIQKEIEQLKTEIDRISRDTEFNTMKLLDGTMGATASANGTAGNFKGISMEVVGIGVKDGVYTLAAATAKGTVTAAAVTGGINVGMAGTGKITFIPSTTAAGGDGLGAKYGDYRLEAKTNLGGSYSFTLHGPDGKYEVLDNRTPGTLKFEKLGIQIDATGMVTDSGTLSFTVTDDLKLSLKGTSGNAAGIEIKMTASGYTGGSLNIGGLQFEFRVGFASVASPSTNVTVFDDSIKLHIGANADQNMSISVLDASSRALGVNVVDLKTQSGANAAITTIDNAINRVSSERSKMGAIMNRLDHTIKNLGTTSENLTASESRIRDVDMAKEMMEFTKNNILSQASQAMLAQANMIPQGVLGLLR
ncbi:MAG: flagellin [Clostridiales Family XIII bacterium]|jgi:flagellin|nr:flagellin [Clostridiales Family XIII bacterium]